MLKKDGASVRGGQGGGLGGGHGIGLGDGWKMGSLSTTPPSNGDVWNIFDVPSLLDFSEIQDEAEAAASVTVLIKKNRT